MGAQQVVAELSERGPSANSRGETRRRGPVAPLYSSVAPLHGSPNGPKDGRGRGPFSFGERRDLTEAKRLLKNPTSSRRQAGLVSDQTAGQACEHLADLGGPCMTSLVRVSSEPLVRVDSGLLQQNKIICADVALPSKDVRSPRVQPHLLNLPMRHAV